MRAAIERAEPLGSYAGSATESATARAALRRGRSDVCSTTWIAVADARTPMLDGSRATYDVDRSAWRRAVDALRRRDVAAGVPEPLVAAAARERRFLLSGYPCGGPGVAARAIAFDEIATPLRLYEIRGALPRVFWFPRGRRPARELLRSVAVTPRAPSWCTTVSYERPTAHDPDPLLGPAGVPSSSKAGSGWHARARLGRAPSSSQRRSWALPFRKGGRFHGPLSAACRLSLGLASATPARRRNGSRGRVASLPLDTPRAARENRAY